MPNPVSRWRYELLALAVALVGSGLHYLTTSPIVGIDKAKHSAFERAVAQLEGRASDLKFRLRGERPAEPSVMVVAIDEKSAQKYGLWPWPRSILAQALTNLVDAEVKAVGLDIVFADKTADEHLVEREVLEALKKVEELPPQLEPLKAKLSRLSEDSPDAALEKALRHGGQTIIQGTIPLGDDEIEGTFTPEQIKRYDESLEPFLIRKMTIGPNVTIEPPIGKLPMWVYTSSQMPLENEDVHFATAGSRIGHFAMVPDVDGTIRRTALFARLTNTNGLLPSMALQTAAQALGATVEPAWNRGESDLQGANLLLPDGSKVTVPFEPSSSFTLVDYDGPSSVIRTVSVKDVIEKTIGKAELAGKTVLIGVTITGSSGDQRVTPFHEIEPGVYTHAAMVSNILSRRFLTRSWSARWLEMLAVILISIALAASIAKTRSFFAKFVLASVGVAAWVLVDFMLFTRGTQVATIVPVATLFASSFGTIFLGYLSVDREKLKMRSTFSRYLGEDVMEVALANPDLLNRGEKREMTVLFSDIRGFTTLSERMSPEQLADFINQYLSPMTQIVFDEKGTLDKYIGDAVMAFWNAPLTQADHAIRACRASVKMLVKLQELRAGWRAAGLPELEIGIGVNTGPMIVGNMGSDVRVDYTVLGDAVNLGSRLEGTNKEYDTQIIIAESTWVTAKDVMICRKLGGVRVKGKKLPVNIFELRGEGHFMLLPSMVEAEQSTTM